MRVILSSDLPQVNARTSPRHVTPGRVRWRAPMLALVPSLLLLLASTAVPSESSPDQAEAYWKKGEELYRTYYLGEDRFGRAMRWYEKAVALRPKDYRFLWEIAARYQVFGQTLPKDRKRQKIELWKKGLAYARKAVEVNPEGKEGHFYYMANLGAIAQLQGSLSSAWKFRRIKREMDKTLELAPDWPPILYARARFLAQMPGIFGGDEEEAMRLYHRVLELDPGFLLAHVSIAEILASRGRYDEAIRHLREVIDCKSPPQYGEWLTIDRPQAEALLEKILKAKGNDGG